MHAGDVTDFDYTVALINDAVSWLGALDVVVNNAGVYHVTPIWEETASAARRVLDVNVMGTFNVCKNAISSMKARQSGSIVNVVSGAQSGMCGASVYGASKGAVASFTYALALELAPFNVRVNAISPRNSIEANLPMVVFLASDAASTVTGQILRTDDTILSLYSHPKPTRHVVNVAGWTVENLCEVFASTIGKSLEPVGLAATTYVYQNGITDAPPPVLGTRSTYSRWTTRDVAPQDFASP
jgi:NADP-dependent 3-hydroxy acid dehydrogenase YdfG